MPCTYFVTQRQEWVGESQVSDTCQWGSEVQQSSSLAASLCSCSSSPRRVTKKRGRSGPYHAHLYFLLQLSTQDED